MNGALTTTQSKRVAAMTSLRLDAGAYLANFSGFFFALFFLRPLLLDTPKADKAMRLGVLESRYRLNAQLSSTWSRRPGAAIPSLGGPLVRPRWLFGETRGTKVRAARPEAPQPARARVSASRAQLSWHLGRLCAERRGAARLTSCPLLLT